MMFRDDREKVCGVACEKDGGDDKALCSVCSAPRSAEGEADQDEPIDYSFSQPHL
jgi:hypothetical protein